jgi:peptidyl-prolyl cis-trans isomerase D
MSIIQRIRDKAAPITVAVIALSLVGFILMDGFAGRGGGNMFSSSGTVGSVNGSKIEYKEFEEKLRNTEERYRQQNMQVDEGMRHQLQEMLWKQLVDEQLVAAEAGKLGLGFTPKELTDLLLSDRAPADFKQGFTDPNTGIFDVAKAREALARIKKTKDADPSKKSFVDYTLALKDQTIRAKYIGLLGGSVYIPKWLIEKQNADNNAMAAVSYVAVPYTTIPDSLAKVTDADISKYISEHKDEYKQEASRSIAYVSFSAAPSKEDSAATLAQVAALRQQFATDTNAQVFVTRNQSSMPFFEGYVQKSKMQMANADSISKLSPGSLFGPYLDANNYVIAKMIGSRSMPDSVKVRHILVSNQSRPDSVAKKLADSILTAVRGGADFKALVTTYTDDAGSKEKGGEYEFTSVDFSRFVKPFSEFSFYQPVGAKDIVKTEFGYHIMEVMSQKNPETAYKIAYMARTILASENTELTASSQATQFAADSRNLKAFEDNIKKKNYNKLLASDIKATDAQLGNLGMSRKLVRWIFDSKKGEVSAPENIGDQYIVACVTEVNEEGVQSAAKARPRTEMLVRNKIKAGIIAKKIGSPASLEAAAAAYNVQVGKADSVSFGSGFIPNLGPEPKVVGAAFNKNFAGKVSPPIEGGQGVYVIRVDNTYSKPADNSNIDQQRKAAEGNMRQGAYSAIEGLRKAAKIKDSRAKFY